MTTQTDREPLELAAKAAGIGLHQWVESTNEFMTTNSNGWNPLADDGDALRLAVKLRLSTDFSNHGLSAYRHGEDDFIWFTPYDDDAVAATRRAIVRAAAEIGRAMS
jgi:hypothetical protein